MPFGKPKEPKAPKEKKPRPPKKEKPTKKPKPAKKPRPVKKPKPPKKVKPTKKPRKGAPPQGEEGQEGEQPPKKKPILLFILIPVVVAAVAAALVFFVIMPRLSSQDPDPEVTEEPKPPELPEELKVGEESVPGMALEADESGALAVLAKTITYTYTNLNDAGKAAETYVGQLKGADPAFSIVDEEFVRLKDAPDFTTAEGMVLLARNLPKPEPEGGAETPAPTEEPKEGESAVPDSSAQPSQSPPPEESAPPADEAPDMVLTVRITWSKAEGQCVVTADEAEGKVTSPPPEEVPPTYSIGIRQAENQIRSMTPAELGLPGTSMADYEVFPQDVLETVDDITYIRLNIYDSVSPYAFVGSYLMGVDGKHLYQVEADTGELVELDFTLNLDGPETAAPESAAPATGAPESGAPESAAP